MRMETLTTALLDLAHELPELSAPFLVGGGFGLYLRQKDLEDQPELDTLIPGELWPPARATEDVDLFLPTAVIIDLRSMQEIRAALDRLGYRPLVPCFQFVKDTELGPVRVDLLTCDVRGTQAHKVRIKPPRVRPVGDVELHAYLTQEALALELQPYEIAIEGPRSDGTFSAMVVRVPNPFTYLLMKLHAFRDRLHDQRKDLGQHHAVDLYRIIAMLNREEYDLVAQLVREHTDAAATVAARRVVGESFASESAVGVLRLVAGARNAGVPRADLRTGDFRDALRELFGSRGG